MPAAVIGQSLAGEPVTQPLQSLTLIVVIKPACDGCRDFVHSDLAELSLVPVIIVSAQPDLNGEWAGARQRVIVAPEVLADLDIRWPPCYVLVDPVGQRIVTEGVVFNAAQVAVEIAPFLV